MSALAHEMISDEEPQVANDQPRPHRWTRFQYLQMGEVGILDPAQRTELIDGEILEMSPMNRRHAVGVIKVRDALLRVFASGYYVSDQLPLALADLSEPLPDVAVFPGSADDYLDDHPTGPVLVVEVSDTSLQYDRTRKAALYAQAGVPEYWVLDLVHRRLEVRRDPVSQRDDAPREYASVAVYQPTESVTCLAAPEDPIQVADLLPRRREGNEE